jgi:succinate dehydrogenase flavin-adding protein (antitoxin of CptAB toxin-antitoxin module)
MNNERIKRLIHRSKYRGFLEIDLILENFAKKVLPRLSEADIDDYERLLDEPDQDIFAWITQRRPVPARHDNAVMATLQQLDVSAP